MGTDVWGEGGVPGEGPYIVLHLEVDGDVVGEGRFESNGCPAAHHAACAALVVAKGRSPERMALIEGKDLELLAGPLPDGKGFYYDLAAQALRNCMSQVKG